MIIAVEVFPKVSEASWILCGSDDQRIQFVATSCVAGEHDCHSVFIFFHTFIIVLRVGKDFSGSISKFKAVSSQLYT